MPSTLFRYRLVVIPSRIVRQILIHWLALEWQSHLHALVTAADKVCNNQVSTRLDKEYYEKKFRKYHDGLTYQEKIRWLKDFKAKRAEAIPTEYDILACLTTYDVGSMDDFMSEFGYEIKCTKDMTNFINTYNAVVKEYNDVRRCFTEEQIEAMCEIW